MGFVCSVLDLKLGFRFWVFDTQALHYPPQVVFALAGLVSFALVLTLVEQVIMSLIEANVTTGARQPRSRLKRYALIFEPSRVYLSRTVSP